MENVIELAKAGKVIRVCFPHKEHKRMWGILSEWEGGEDNENQEYASVQKKEEVLESMGFNSEIVDAACFACWADRIFKNNNTNTPLTCINTCPLKWTNREGNPSPTCHDIYHAWMHASGEEKKKFARIIRDMPLKDEAELLYNIVR